MEVLFLYNDRAMDALYKPKLQEDHCFSQMLIHKPRK